MMREIMDYYKDNALCPCDLPRVPEDHDTERRQEVKERIICLLSCCSATVLVKEL